MIGNKLNTAVVKELKARPGKYLKAKQGKEVKARIPNNEKELTARIGKEEGSESKAWGVTEGNIREETEGEAREGTEGKNTNESKGISREGAESKAWGITEGNIREETEAEAREGTEGKNTNGSKGMGGELKVKLHHETLRRLLSSRERNESAVDIPESADVVVIGGGSAGCHTLYQLAKRGVNAVLLERAKVTSGTTWHTAGCLWRLRPNDVDTQLLNDTRHVLMQLEADTGLHPGWISNGGLFIADRKERLDEYERLATAGLSFNVESSIKSPKETKELFPLIDDKAIIGSLYSPGDGVIDPAMLCAALTKGATKRGAKVIENCRVLNILTEKNMMGSKEVREVVTSHGNIQTKCVVNCAGVWAVDLAAMVGMQIPLVPMKHSYIISESIPEVRGLPNIRDHDSSTYFRMQGESICMGGYENNPIILDKVPSDFEFSLYELDWSAFSANMQGAIKLVPAFEKVGIKTTVCGPESFTPDHKALLGEDPCVRGFYYHCGHNSSGMMLGGGCGIQMAQWIINGRPDLHMFNYDIRRFLPAQRKNREWSIARSHESYTRNYYIVFPHDERLAGRNLIQGPLYQEHLESGCVFQERQGFERPGWFSKGGAAPIQKYDWYGAYGNVPHTKHQYSELLELDYTFDFTGNHKMIGEECLACREHVALFDMSSAGKFYLSGADAVEAVNWLFTSDIKETPGRTTYTCALNNMAGAEADLTVSSIQPGTGGQVDPIFKGNGFYIVTGGGSYYHCWTHLKQALSMKNLNVNLLDVSSKIGILSLQGPKSYTLLQSLTDEDVSEEAFQYCSNKLIKIVGGHLCRAIRISFVGELGWELHLPWDSCASVYRAIIAEGAKHGLHNAGYRALDSLSCEKGYVLWHADLQSCDNPLEAGLGYLCRKTGNFLGKEALDKVREKGPTKKLAFFQLHEKVPVWGLETILRDGQVVGYLRRGEYGYALGASIGKGYVSHPERRQVTSEFLLNGHYQLEIMRKRYDATIYLKSPFDPTGKRLHGVYDDALPIRQ